MLSAQHTVLQQQLPKPREPIRLLHQQCLQEVAERVKHNSTVSFHFCCAPDDRDLIHRLRVLLTLKQTHIVAAKS